METLQLATVQSAMLRLLRHYPESGHNGRTIKALAEDYHEDMVEEGVTSRQFERGIRQARKTCRFYPKVADLLNAIKADLARIDQGPEQQRQALPEQTSQHDLTPEEIESYNEKINAIRDMAVKKISMSEALEKVRTPDRFKGRLFVSGN